MYRYLKDRNWSTQINNNFSSEKKKKILNPFLLNLLVNNLVLLLKTRFFGYDAFNNNFRSAATIY